VPASEAATIKTAMSIDNIMAVLRIDNIIDSGVKPKEFQLILLALVTGKTPWYIGTMYHLYQQQQQQQGHTDRTPAVCGKGQVRPVFGSRRACRYKAICLKHGRDSTWTASA
jgi:hypothetical protein